MDVAKIEYFFNAVNKDTMHLVDELYDRNAVLEDPIGKRVGSDAIKAYYAELYKNVREIRFDFSDSLSQSEKFVVVWKMRLVSSGLNSGKPVVVEGNSLLRVDLKTDKVTYHRDYFDMGAFIYEHIPVLGSAVRFVKSKLEKP